MSSDEAIKKYLESKKILIADRSSATRDMVRKIIVSMGANVLNIKSTGRISDALAYVSREQPQVIFADMDFDGHSAMELLAVMNSYINNLRERIFFIITANTQEMAVAEAAEEDVDNYILKPFTTEDFEEYLLKTVRSKISPSPFLKSIEAGRKALKNKDYQTALKFSLEAKNQTDIPTLACYYAGESYRGLNELPQALQQFNEGLLFNRIHYKCLIGKFETLDEQKKIKEAYEVVQEITKYFPISPQRLGRIFKLAVYTQNFTDAEKYYEIYEKLERKPKQLREIVTAALFVCGKYLIQHQRIEEAVEAFKHSIINSKLDTKFLENIIIYLKENNLNEEGFELLEIYPIDKQNSPEFKYLKAILNYGLKDYDKTINLSKELIKLNHANETIYKMLAESYIMKERFKLAENTLYEAIQEFPKERNTFTLLLDNLQSRENTKTSA